MAIGFQLGDVHWNDLRSHGMWLYRRSYRSTRCIGIGVSSDYRSDIPTILRKVQWRLARWENHQRPIAWFLLDSRTQLLFRDRPLGASWSGDVRRQLVYRLWSIAR